MRYAIGLDIGIESVGWSILELSHEEAPMRIVDLGVRIFDKAEQPKTGASLAAPRREARGQRRRIRRRKHRKERIYNLIISSNILTKEKIASLYEGKLSDIYDIRRKALDFVVTNEEFARILLHLSQRRGFKSNRKSLDENDNTNGKILLAISNNKVKLEEKKYRTIGEMLSLDESFKTQKRNKNDDYKNTFSRDLIEDEARKIFEAQRKFGMSFASKEIEEKYIEILLSQRSFAEGPGSGPYSGNQIEKMIGTCTFENGEYRCAKSTYSFQIFNLWQRLNHLKINTSTGVRSLTDDERKAIFEYAHKHKLTYSNIRKIIGKGMEDTDTFVGIRYDDDIKKAENKEIKDLSVYHEIRKCIKSVSNDAFENLTHEQLDIIGEAFSKNLSDSDILVKLGDDFSFEIKQALLKLPNYPKYGHLSLIACKKLLPYLEKGLTYDKACIEAGYNPKGNDGNTTKYLPPINNEDDKITNPVVKRSISQTIKVINAIIRKMNEVSPVYINIELARELSMNFDERRKIEKIYMENAKENEEVVEQIKSYGVLRPTGQDIVKFKLWNEQGGICPYSQEYMSIEKLFEPGYVDVDHIVPYSRSFDDRIVNKVLVKSSENRQKGNRLPLEYLQGIKREKFIVWVNNQKYKRAKKNLLLKEKIDDELGWKTRNLQDTQYISSYIYNYVLSKLEFSQSNIDKKRKVYAVNGVVTAYVRKRWGINKIRANGDLHHAIDATVVGCISQSMINIIQKYAYYKETYELGAYKINKSTGELIDRFPMPWDYFRNELDIRLETNTNTMRKMLLDVSYQSYSDVDLNDLKSPFVSKMSNHKISGTAHKATVKSKILDNGEICLVSKTDIKKLKLDKNGEIFNYYNPNSDRLLYEALKKQLVEFKNDGEKAFAEPFYKPRSDGSRGPIVKKVKIVEISSRYVDVQNKTAAANNDTMVRCDVFFAENEGYYFVPIYVADTVKSQLPRLACVSGKNRPWKEVKDEDFVFSLYPNDLIKYYSKKVISLNNTKKDSTLPIKKEINGEEGVLLYYKGLDISTAVLSAVTHDNVYESRTIGKTSKKLEKYEVDVLGNYVKVNKETRRSFNLNK